VAREWNRERNGNPPKPVRAALRYSFCIAIGDLDGLGID